MTLKELKEIEALLRRLVKIQEFNPPLYQMIASIIKHGPQVPPIHVSATLYAHLVSLCGRRLDENGEAGVFCQKECDHYAECYETWVSMKLSDTALQKITGGCSIDLALSILGRGRTNIERTK